MYTTVMCMLEIVAPPIVVGAWSMAFLLRQHVEYYYYGKKLHRLAPAGTSRQYLVVTAVSYRYTRWHLQLGPGRDQQAISGSDGSLLQIYALAFAARPRRGPAGNIW